MPVRADDAVLGTARELVEAMGRAASGALDDSTERGFDGAPRLGAEGRPPRIIDVSAPAICPGAAGGLRRDNTGEWLPRRSPSFPGGPRPAEDRAGCSLVLALGAGPAGPPTPAPSTRPARWRGPGSPGIPWRAR
ncbi:hypothetical protein HBB16_19070 [Pseudonocardia sp. MCCB 268]|nr:hypothetical protein [Pseudonocardia cytotoxica]